MFNCWLVLPCWLAIAHSLTRHIIHACVHGLLSFLSSPAHHPLLPIPSQCYPISTHIALISRSLHNVIPCPHISPSSPDPFTMLSNLHTYTYHLLLFIASSLFPRFCTSPVVSNNLIFSSIPPSSM